MNPGTGTSTHILSGWKDIANYLGKGVRTVQRYEGELRLPVRRPAGRAHGAVVATRAELDAWVAASPVREQLHKGTNPGAASSVAGIRQNLHEMRILREQMRGLRSEMKHSVRLLQASISQLQGCVREKDARPLYKVRTIGVAGDFGYLKAS